eukprot:NODE_2157_length_975_cov_49.344492_g1771_i0.p1 GENE.NODE_2157_length_975_cov_49.344492_g1771_i0~~NODE_2157_length_975_cov_49.344492_g1771_i0.p1  ORF type:complete len:163 (-),score=18.95 NODE_2157_length_975_cov_49.344492_g1771_i0:15-503(-)
MKLATVASFNQFAGGFELKTEKVKFKNVDVGFRYTGEDLNVSASALKNGKKWNLGAVHQLNDSLTVGIEFNAEKDVFAKMKEEEKEEEKKEEQVGKLKAQVGLKYKVCDTETLKVKLNTDGVVSWGYEFDVRENLKADVCCESNVANFNAGFKCGVGIKFSN